MRRHRCRKGFWGVQKTPSPTHVSSRGLGGRMDPRGSEYFHGNTGISVHKGEWSQLLPTQQPVASSVPVVAPSLLDISPKTPRLLSHLAEPPFPAASHREKRVKIGGKGEIWIPHPGRLRLGELVGSGGGDRRGERARCAAEKAFPNPPGCQAHPKLLLCLRSGSAPPSQLPQLGGVGSSR